MEFDGHGRNLKWLQRWRIAPLRERPCEEKGLQQRTCFQNRLQQLPLAWQWLPHRKAIDHRGCPVVVGAALRGLPLWSAHARQFWRTHVVEEGIDGRCGVRMVVGSPREAIGLGEAATPSRLPHLRAVRQRDLVEDKLQLIPRHVSFVGDHLEVVDQLFDVLLALPYLLLGIGPQRFQLRRRTQKLMLQVLDALFEQGRKAEYDSARGETEQR